MHFFPFLGGGKEEKVKMLRLRGQRLSMFFSIQVHYALLVLLFESFQGQMEYTYSCRSP